MSLAGTQDSSLIITVTVYFCVGKCEHNNSPESCVISGFFRGADENYTLFSYYAGISDNSLPTFRDNLSVPGWDKNLDSRPLLTVHSPEERSPPERCFHLINSWPQFCSYIREIQ
jgi:hypothetical protein